MFYAAVVASAAGALSEIMADVQRAAGATERLFELLDQRPQITAPAIPRNLPQPLTGAVRFEQVRFAYPSHPERPVLRDLDIAVEPGTTVALVGPSGAGKTSVFQLLMRFYDPGGSRVLLDGIDLRQLEPAALRARIGLVPQDPVIFSADAWHNLRYGRPEASDAEVRAAADAARASEFLDRLPAGFDTFLGEKGLRLSGGQRQRIAIARAILRPGGPVARRGHELAGCRERAAGPGRLAPPAPGPHHAGDRAPPGDGTGSGPDHRHGSRAGGGDRHPPGAGRTGRAVCPARRLQFDVAGRLAAE